MLLLNSRELINFFLIFFSEVVWEGMFLFDVERLIAMYNGTLVFVFQTLGIKLDSIEVERLSQA